MGTFFFLEFGRCRTVARSLHEHKQSKRHLYKDPEGPEVQANHNKPKTTQKQQDDPQIPQPDLRFVKAKNSKPDTQRGKSPNNNTHKKDLPRDTAVLPLCHTQKHAKINYPPRHSVKHRNRGIVHTVVGIEQKTVQGHGPTKIASLSVLSDVLVHKATMQRTKIVHPLLIGMSQWSLYQAPPQQGGADGIGVQEDLQTRCKSSIQPSQRTECRAPSFKRARCALLTK